MEEFTNGKGIYCMKIEKVGVVGCGLMGSGIVEVCARAGYSVTVSEVNQQLLDKGLAAITNSITRAAERGKITDEDKKATLGRIKGTTNLEDFKNCNLVIEAVLEDMARKKDIFRLLDKVCPKTSILATNTSCLAIIEMAMSTQRPDKVLGIHFFNPAPVMKLVEIVKPIAVSQETVSDAKAFAESLGKKVIFAPDSPGFVVNRLLVPFIIDSIRIYEAGTATAEDIDQGMVLGCNHPMGPLALADLVGLDTLVMVGNAMYEEFKEPRFAPTPLLKKMVAAGRLGRKTGRGFYQYS
ncbi:MAG: 3-hydroxybutyryl-CoA dehydrogenase [Dehalococcoidia bacterium]|nr:3-hydroxybutyryl-CoA dehydrogenase [Dehalococcoidia bacterium]